MRVKGLSKNMCYISHKGEYSMRIDRLKDLREDNDEKQEAIAILLKITRQQYQLYESGKRKLPVDFLPALCGHFNVSADYLLGLIDEPLSYKR